MKPKFHSKISFPLSGMPLSSSMYDKKNGYLISKCPFILKSICERFSFVFLCSTDLSALRLHQGRIPKFPKIQHFRGKDIQIGMSLSEKNPFKNFHCISYYLNFCWRYAHITEESNSSQPWVQWKWNQNMFCLECLLNVSGWWAAGRLSKWFWLRRLPNGFGLRCLTNGCRLMGMDDENMLKDSKHGRI